MPSRKSNPFYQPARQWQLRIPAPAHAVPALEEAFADVALASLSFETDEKAALWAIDIITDTPPEKADIASRLALASGLLDIPTPIVEVKKLEPKDWVSEVERTFPPIHVGRFFVHGSHIEGEPPKGKIALMVNAGAAFGSGEHATTSGCLLALDRLARRRSFDRPLDMGCGSGILALAMAKLWRTEILGIDIDPVSVTVARENAMLNGVRDLLRFEAGNGYAAKAVRDCAPFDIIVANILARPLVRMAPKLAANLASGGIIVLSGLLASQERMVLSAHRAQGLRLVKRIPLAGWHTLVLAKD